MLLSLTLTAHAGHVPCWVRCHSPQKLSRPLKSQEVSAALRDKSNTPLSRTARFLGFFTTYLGKYLGIQGWHDYHMVAQADGVVEHQAGSTDGLYTIDLRLNSLTVAGTLIPLAKISYLRIEVFPRAKRGAQLPVKVGDQLCISGKFMWDGDGFFEIHPPTGQDVQHQSCGDVQAAKKVRSRGTILTAHGMSHVSLALRSVQISLQIATKIPETAKTTNIGGSQDAKASIPSVSRK